MVEAHSEGVVTCRSTLAVEGKGASNEVEKMLQDLVGSGNGNGNSKKQ